MGIEVYARWKGQNDKDKEAQRDASRGGSRGHVGYIFEAYREPQYATKHLVPEAFAGSPEEVAIPAKVLRERLPIALALAEERIRNESWSVDQKEIDDIRRQYTAFVELCERVEKETGKPVSIEVDW